ncbi:MAG: serine/threonine-protein kinase [Gemmataceae bacterium]
MSGRHGFHTPVDRRAPRPDQIVTSAMQPQDLAAAAQANDGMPRTLAQYELRAKLGEGGMGVVYRAHDSALDRPVALKLLRPELFNSPEARARFLREARAAAAVRSDYVVTTYQVGEVSGVLFLAMELLDGISLDARLERGPPLSLVEAARIGREAALGLAAAHERGLVHRDVKPANLWLEAPKGRTKVLDFGLARPTGDGQRITATGVIIGTPTFMSPEQARNVAVDHRSDLFSLGSVLYRLATGRLPFQGDSAFAVLTALAVDTPIPARQVVSRVPESLANLIDQLLAKNPADRPRSAAEVAQRLAGIEAILSAPPRRRPPEATPSPRVPMKAPLHLRSLVVHRRATEPSPRNWPVAIALIGMVFGAILVTGAMALKIADPDGLILATVLARLQPEPAAPPRTLWRRHDGQGHLEKVGKSQWLEHASDQPDSPYSLSEAIATPDHIVLFDPNRRLTLWVLADRVETGAKDQRRVLYSGAWAIPRTKGKPSG